MEEIAKLKIEHRISVIILLALFASACGYRQGELNGEIFIVTKGGENIRLGLVTVQAISEDKMKEYITKKISESKYNIDRLGIDIDKSKEEYHIAEKDEILSEDEYKRRFRLWTKNVSSKQGKKYYQEAYNIYKEKRDKSLDKKNKFYSLQKTRIYYKSAGYYFNGLPESVATGKTGADGRFSIPIQRNKRVALAAHASRQVFDHKEEYYWLLWVSLDGESSKKIFLSNDNMTDVGAKDSVITTKY